MFDVIIIGGGPAGYIAAERIGCDKKKVLLIEQQYLGGTCLNIGCIPAKTLLNSAKKFVHAIESEKFGINVQGVSFNWTAIQNRKNEVVIKLRRGIESKMKRFGVEVINGRVEIVSPPFGAKPAVVKSYSPNGEFRHEGKTILVCAGSVPMMPAIPGVKDNPFVSDSTGLLAAEAVPKRLAIIGGGVIGVEFAWLFSSLGCEVTIIEMTDEIIPFMDKAQAPVLCRALRKDISCSMKGVDFKLGCKVEKIDNAAVCYTTKDGNQETLEADLVLLAAGRQPAPDTWGAAGAGIDITSSGVNVDDLMRTNIPRIWAAGDVTGKCFLAHCAYRMGEVAAADILAMLDGNQTDTLKPDMLKRNLPNRMRYNAIPWAVYGIVEAAGVGITEQEALAKGINFIKASLPMKMSGRFIAENSFVDEGVVKVIADAANRRILGIHAVGAYASEFIWGGAALIEQEFRVDEVKQLIFPHPTVSELIRDVVWDLE